MISSLIHKTLSTKIRRKYYPRKKIKDRKDTDPRKTSAGRTMIAIVDDEELAKRKASRIPQNTRTNTSWAVRVWFEWAEERNDLIQTIGDSETIPKVDPEILNIIDKGGLDYRLKKFVVEVCKKKDPGNI